MKSVHFDLLILLGSLDRSLSVDQFSYFSFQSVLHDWKVVIYVILSEGDGAYKRTFDANRKE